ncbi:flagellar motor protein MotB [Legionella nagasakiensis]|uniref:flagellar motor protein MotB n=1 Tax=Legionella nagasakiensis TaxID=535290 RepID=UPI0010547066|nr:flagellar motor protein MotB [Legionella nagasakiensis]
MSEQGNKIVIIKRIKKNKAPHHGGAWKIAYADFVTAMMAFFMLMWLLSLLNKYELEGIAEYFKKPLVGTHANKKDKISPEKIEDTLPEEYEEEEKNSSNQETTPKDTSLEEIKKNLEESLSKNEEIKHFSDQLNFEVTEDGLKVDLHELENKAMFQIGKSDFNDHAKRIIQWLSKELNNTSHKIVIIGHTDSYQFKNDGRYTNWELSADRANSMRKLLIQYGMSSDKIIRIQGAANTDLLDKTNGDAPKNRRIEIIILTDRAATKLTN